MELMHTPSSLQFESETSNADRNVIADSVRKSDGLCNYLWTSCLLQVR